MKKEKILMPFEEYSKAKKLFLDEDLDGGFLLLELFKNQIQVPYPINLHWHQKYAMFGYGTSKFGAPMRTEVGENKITVTLIFNLSSEHLFSGCGKDFQYIYPVAETVFDIFPDGEVVLTKTSILRQ